MAAEGGAGGDVGVVADGAVVVDGAAGVDDHVGADVGVAVDGGVGHDHGAGADGDAGADLGTGVDGGGEVVALLAEAGGDRLAGGVMADGDDPLALTGAEGGACEDGDIVEKGETGGGAIVDEGGDGVVVALEDVKDDPTVAAGAVDVDGEHIPYGSISRSRRNPSVNFKNLPSRGWVSETVACHTTTFLPSSK